MSYFFLFTAHLRDYILYLYFAVSSSFTLKNDRLYHVYQTTFLFVTFMQQCYIHLISRIPAAMGRPANAATLRSSALLFCSVARILHPTPIFTLFQTLQVVGLYGTFSLSSGIFKLLYRFIVLSVLRHLSPSSYTYILITLYIHITSYVYTEHPSFYLSQGIYGAMPISQRGYRQTATASRGCYVMLRNYHSSYQTVARAPCAQNTGRSLVPDDRRL